LETFAEAVRIVCKVWDMGVNPSWICWNRYKTSDDELVMAVHAPEPVLEAIESALQNLSEARCEVGPTVAVSQKRAELEASHPDRRALGTAIRTVHTVFSNRDVLEAVESLPASVEAVSIWNWTRHHAHAYVRYAKGKTLSELPANISGRALDVRPVIDDEAVHWPHSAQTLKTTLDPDNALAVGP
jgi:hypothetical protein